MKFSKLLLLLAVLAVPVQPALAQNYANSTFTRNNPKFIQAFRTVVVKPSASTVRILCDDKDTALGMVVGPDGWVLTKANDLKGKVAVKLKDGQVHEAKVVGIHKEHDLAMLKIDAQGLTPVEFKESKKTSAGDWVACAGLGDEPVAIGVVSVATRNVLNKGPLITIDSTKAGYLGIGLEPGEKGIRVKEVMPNTAADKAGLKAQDIILALGTKKITEVDVFIGTIAKRKPGDVVTLKVRRGEEELELKATLGKRPANMSRGDMQNKMGSELSVRRSGYPTILQHDSVVKPNDCGGPIVDLDGRVIGINICRAGRTESWAVPTEIIQSVLLDLKSGKLAPPEEKADPAEQSKEEMPEEARLRLQEDPVDRLLALMRQRLRLMEDVAYFKWVNNKPVADPEREKQLLESLLEKSKAHALDGDLVKSFFTAQMAAARTLQEELFKRWGSPDRARPANSAVDLQSVLRPKIDQVSAELLIALAKVQPHLRGQAFQKRIHDRAANVLAGDAVSAAVRAKALAGWLSGR